MLFVFLCEHFVRVFDYFRSILRKIDGNSGMILSGSHLAIKCVKTGDMYAGRRKKPTIF